MTPSSPRFVSVRSFARWSLAAGSGFIIGSAAHGQAGVPAGNLGSGGNQPAYVIPYHKSTVEEVTEVLGRVRAYLETATVGKIVDRQTNAEITDFSRPNPTAAFERGEAFPSSR